MGRMAARNHVDRVLSVVSNPAAADRSGVANSWRRCLVDHKLDPARLGPPQTLTQSELKMSAAAMDELIRIAMPELDMLHGVVREAGYCVNLADTAATIMVSRLPDGDAATTLRDWKIYTGSVFSEAVEGTNGLGTALAEERPTTVQHHEHFREQWAMFSCAVAPVFDEVGRLAGAVNITSCRADLDRAAHQMALAITVQAARRIEQAIFRTRFRNGWILALARSGSGDGALVAFDEDQRLLGATRAARRALDLSDEAIASGLLLSQALRLDGARLDLSAEQTRLLGRGGVGFGHLAAPVRPASGPAGRRERSGEVRRDADLLRLAGSDPALMRSVSRLARIADATIPVLLQGETGSGKDAFARAIHASGARAGRPYVALNCAAMPESLIDAELFGYEGGAFTGARRSGSKGLIAQADGGTLFLDEIGDMPPALQTRLLRVLENREVRPLGALRPVPVDVRLISATHRDLGAMVADGGFRADLYYRLRGLQIDLPPLRERGDKAEVIARVAAEEAPLARLTAEARAALMAYAFPGNIRQLRHVLRLAGCTADGGLIAPGDLDLPPCAAEAPAADFETAERNVIADALHRAGGHVLEAARSLKISRATLYRKMKAFGIEPARAH